VIFRIEDNFPKQNCVTGGKIEGRRVVTSRGGRRINQLLYELKES
jgi:hypothetical protein